MPFTLSKQRDRDVVLAFKKYRTYVRKVKKSMPARAHSLAMSDWYFNTNDHRCPHDARLVQVSIQETSRSKNIFQRRTVSIRIKLLGAYGDVYLEFFYPKVFAYSLDFNSPDRYGHRDWLYDEFRISKSKRLIHEIEWYAISETSRWLIEASEVRFRKYSVDGHNGTA